MSIRIILNFNKGIHLLRGFNLMFTKCMIHQNVSDKWQTLIMSNQWIAWRKY